MISDLTGSSSVLLTDLYQLTMLQGYFDQGMEESAVFEFFVRKLPPQRNFLVAAGLEQALSFLENLRFTPEELEWVARPLCVISKNYVSPVMSTPYRRGQWFSPTSRFCA
jgi:nicotinic acid phosphoribosyltransferase